MSLLEIIKVVGFGTGAALHFYIAWLILRRLQLSGLSASAFSREAELPSPSNQDVVQPRDRFGLIHAERTFIMLGLCLGLWFLGNMLITFQEILLGPGRSTAFLRAWSTVTVVGIALFPSALLHCHVAFWSWMDGYRVMSRSRVRSAAVLSYVPMVFLPYVVFRINTGDYKPYLAKLHFFLVPYSIWFLLALWSSAALDWKMKDRLYEWAVREKAFLKALSILLFMIGAVEFVVVAIRRIGPNNYLWVAFVLLSLMPTVTIAYYIYRYGLYELVIKGSLVYATFAVLFLVVYTYGIRHLDAFLVKRFEIKAGVVEGILILAMFAAAGPLMRLIDGTVRRLFATEIELYRDVVGKMAAATSGNSGSTIGLRRPSAASAGRSALDEPAGTAIAERSINDLSELISYAERTIRNGLELSRVAIIATDGATPDPIVAGVFEKLARSGGSMLELDEDVAALGGTNACALTREGNPVGLMVFAAEPGTLTSEKKAVLEVLAGQVATGIETCRLIGEKVKLERELAVRERLSALGQMAATVAHEVKNPLSSIKSIAQVMREDEAIQNYRRDLDLIVDEIDRLNRTVSQLLAFARKGGRVGPESVREATVSELLSSTTALLADDARRRGVTVRIALKCQARLGSDCWNSLKEIISNLVLNAIQASEPRSEVTIEAECGASLAGPANSTSGPTPGGPSLVLKVSDSGPGIAADLQERVFEPFYTTRPRGTGLGLAIVSRRVSELGGDIKLMSPSADGKGTCFIVTVPLGGARIEMTPER